MFDAPHEVVVNQALAGVRFPFRNSGSNLAQKAMKTLRS